MKARLDKLLVERRLAESQQKAQAMIMAGLVEVNGVRTEKAGTLVVDGCRINIKGKECPYVSRGGLKLAKGLDFFKIRPVDFC